MGGGVSHFAAGTPAYFCDKPTGAEQNWMRVYYGRHPATDIPPHKVGRALPFFAV